MNKEETAIITSSFPETADIETSNDDYATRFSGAVGKWMLDVQEKGVLKLLCSRLLPGARVLDVGGGHGQLAYPLSRDGYQVEVIGSDESCRHRIDELITSGKCTFKVGNVIDLPYGDNSFDAVVSVRMLTHCMQWEKLVSEMCRVSKGIVITDYPTSQSLNAGAPALFKAKKKYEKNTRHWRLFRHSEVDNAFQAAGYQRTGRFVQFFLPMVVHRLMKCKPLSTFMEGVFRFACFTRIWGSPVIVRMERSDFTEKDKKEVTK
ncbi:MAG: class I SAM-dependent methyltransferase [Lentisphaerae bacterium]|jgi:ubiquinone/menaquinone biosynthesis C-methylase UbiE|nr:class I SAM-dependent methyltransferase [Lentisphaerota bacterium]